MIPALGFPMHNYGKKQHKKFYEKKKVDLWRMSNSQIH